MHDYYVLGSCCVFRLFALFVCYYLRAELGPRANRGMSAHLYLVGEEIVTTITEGRELP